jgi:hypothetical protein
MKLRFLPAAACAALLTTAAYAQTAGGPPIAYVKRVSNGDEIHLISADGTERLRIYKAPSKITIPMLDLRPGGGEVAFLENYYTLKILAFDELGRPLPGNPRLIRRVSSPCSLESPDYHPTNGSLLFVEGCGRDRAVWTVQSGASQRDATPLFSSVPVFRARWSRLGDTIYYIGLRDGAASSDPTYLYRRVGTAGPEELGVLNTWSTFDVARAGEKVFWSVDANGFKMLDLSVAGATTADAVLLNCPYGTRMTRSSDDNQMAFQSPQARGKGNYVMIGVTNCATDPTALTGQASWGPLDWRADQPLAPSP